MQAIKSVSLNSHGQAIGEAVNHWQGAGYPKQRVLEGRFCRLVLLDAESHSADLYQAFSLDKRGKLWTYLFCDPPDSEAELRQWIHEKNTEKNSVYYAIIDHQTNQAIGLVAYLRINPSMGTIEVGNIIYSPLLQRRPHATEAMFLLMQYAFEVLGYRRYEWKCDDLNQASCQAAKRLGFQYEGVFRQAIVYKGRNRNTAWFSIIDKDWQPLKAGFVAWLSPDNFDDKGGQRQTLQALFKKTS